MTSFSGSTRNRLIAVVVALAVTTVAIAVMAMMNRKPTSEAQAEEQADKQPVILFNRLRRRRKVS